MGDRTAKDNSGSVVKKPAMPFVKSVSERIELINGPTDVIAGLKLKAINMIPAINKILFKRGRRASM
jgi:hypothetical protein